MEHDRYGPIEVSAIFEQPEYYPQQLACFEVSHFKLHCIMLYSRISLEEFLQGGIKDGKVPELVFEQVPFNYPLFIMYSSGTTGVPKCMVHSVGVSML